MKSSSVSPVRQRTIPVSLRIFCTAATLFPWALSNATALPTAPQTFDTTYAPPSGPTINVPAGGNLQAALNSAQPGETIVLQAGGSYTGPFTLPDKTSGSGWIYVVSSNYSKLPSPGQRVGPGDTVNMPEILAPADSSAIETVANSNHFRFVGIEFAPVSGTFVYEVIQIGNSDTSPATLPNNIVFDRCYITADPAQGGRRGVEMDGAYTAVVDSYITGFQETASDNQGLWAYNTTGPLKIVDDYIEAASENVLFGGADSNSPSLIPSDIDIENNYFFKPLSLVGLNYNIKDLLEFKSAKRVLVSGNVFQNGPAGAQAGFALLVTPRNQDGSAPWSTTTDISITGNTFINVGSGFNIAGYDSNYPNYPATNAGVMTERILVKNNLIGVTGLNGAEGRAFQFTNGGSDFTVDHNTIINTASSASDVAFADTASLPINNFVFTNNLSTPTAYGFFGNAVGTGTAALNSDFTNWTFSKNVFVGDNAAVYPAGNFFPANIAAVQFINYSAGNFALATSSPYTNAGTDGQNIGADFSSTGAVAAMTVAPNPPSNLTIH